MSRPWRVTVNLSREEHAWLVELSKAWACPMAVAMRRMLEASFYVRQSRPMQMGETMLSEFVRIVRESGGKVWLEAKGEQ